MIGTQLGSYQILSKLGEGSMGEVYRARDERLARDVAIKVLPHAVADDPDRLMRFEREAKALAALNHPNVAQIYGVAERGALVMEFVDGETLAQRIARGPVPLADALPIARQIALALEAAHDAGIVHRDLKPANIKLRPDSTVKVLDFGLAKASAAAGQSGTSTAHDTLDSPTITSPAATTAGIVLGTAAYMAPEQAKGRGVDKRADIWAFGCVLFEMLTARRPFHGDSVSETIASVIKDAPDLALLPAGTPPAVRRTLSRCLAKEPSDRLRDIADARLELEQAHADEPAATGAPPAPGSRRRVAILIAAAAAAGVGLGALIASLRSPASAQPPAAVARLLANPLGTAQLADLPDTPALAVAPDGHRVFYVARRSDPDGMRTTASQLVMRPLDAFEPVPLPDLGIYPLAPFISPDGQWLALQTTIGASLAPVLAKRLLTGGPLTVITDLAPLGPLRGGSWTRDGRIVFATSQQGGGLYEVPSSGGTPTMLTRVNTAQAERDHLWPHVLPDDAGILFAIARSDATLDVAVLPRGSQAYRVLLRGASSPSYLPSGHIVYAAAGALYAVGFDLSTLNVTTPPVAIVDDVITKTTGAADYAVSTTGTLVYLPGGERERLYRLAWVTPSGDVAPLPLETRAYRGARLSPDDTRVAVTLGEGALVSMWLYDVARETFTRLSGRGESVRDPEWSRDGRRIAYFSETERGLFIMPVDGGGVPVRLTNAGDAAQYPNAWTPDDERLVFLQGPGALDLFIVPTSPPHTVRQITSAAPPDVEGAVSPNSRWLAHVTFDGRQPEIVIGPLDSTDRRRAVASGGRYPDWSADGRELYYVDEGGVRRVSIDPDTGNVLSKPTLVAPLPPHVDRWGSIDRTRDGKRFLMMQGVEAENRQAEIRVVLNWIDEVKAKIAAVAQ